MILIQTELKEYFIDRTLRVRTNGAWFSLFSLGNEIPSQIQKHFSSVIIFLPISMQFEIFVIFHFCHTRVFIHNYLSLLLLLGNQGMAWF